MVIDEPTPLFSQAIADTQSAQEKPWYYLAKRMIVAERAQRKIGMDLAEARKQLEQMLAE